MEELELHPLINKDHSPHYASTEEPAIQRFERKFTVQKLINWAEISLEKYLDPARKNKGEVDADKTKAETYRNYMFMLKGLVISNPNLLNMSAENAYKKVGIEWRYE